MFPAHSRRDRVPGVLVGTVWATPGFELTQEASVGGEPGEGWGGGTLSGKGLS